ncbi:MAG: hypothetical protein J6V40_05035, partial [Clostridia bacterium]|nr:hypothetical protein [Clostridia bacterium]
LLILIACVLVGCNTPTSVSYASSSITIEVGEYYNISEDKINVAGSSNYTLSFSIDNTSIATISNTTLKGEAIGKTTLRIMARSGLSQVDTTVEIIVIPKIIRANTAKVANSNITLNLQNEYTFNKLTTTNSQGQTVNEVPQISIVPKIVDYNYISGKITGLDTGNAVVTITYAKCSVSFNVEVYNHIYLNSFVCSDIAHSNTITMFSGETGKLNYTFTPANGNTFEFTTTSDNITLTLDGCFETISAGQANVTLKYKTSKNTTITQDFTINVIDKLSSLDITLLSNPHLPDNLPLYNDIVSHNVAVKEKAYLLKVTPNIDIDINKISWSSGFTMLNSWDKRDGSYYTTITFDSIGENSIVAQYSNTIYNVQNKVTSNTYLAKVYSLTNLVTEVRSNLIAIGTTKENYEVYKKPHFLLENLSSAISYIDFAFYLDQEKQIPYNDGIKTYVQTIELSNNVFLARDFAATNDYYTITIKALDTIVDYLYVKVIEPDITLNVNINENITYEDG